MEKQGKFILMIIDEFEKWLNENHFNRVIKLVQNHHTYVPNYPHFINDNHFDMLESMESYHISIDFSEIAQNLTTFPDGTIAVCRSIDKIPAGIKGANKNGICIENVGNFDIGGDIMNDLQKNTIIKANSLLAKKFGLTPSTDTIVYHHWFDLNSGIRTGGTGTTKSCPGTNFFGGNSISDAKQNFIPLIIAAKQGSSPDVQVSDILGTFEVITYGLNVRKGPGVGNAVIKVLQKGTIVKVYKEQDNWCQINAKEQQWVSKSYLKEV